jgi:APA family basic amino acid/polyamine antiporter
MAAEPARAGEAARIEPRLGAFDAAMVVVSLVIGIGIFRTPALVAQAAGSSGRFFAAWIACGLLSLAGALTYAEIGSRLPRTGGYYRAVAEAYNPLLAFMLNWAQAVMQGAGAAGVAFIGAEYLLPLVAPSASRGAVLPVALSLMVVLLALNWIGIRTGARAQNVLSVLKIVMILALGLAPFVLGHAPPPPAALLGGASGAGGMVAAAVACFYAYGGYQMAMNLGGDVRRARRNLPLAICGGMAVVVALYLLINAAYHAALGIGGIAESRLVAAALARATLGASGEAVVSLLIFLSAAGFVNATIIQMPRSYYAMAEDGALPRAFLRVNPRTQAQEGGLIFFGLTMLVPALWLGSFEKLLSYVMFTDALSLAVVASTLFVLRRRRVGEHEGLFRIPLYPVLPAVFMVSLLAVSAHLLVRETRLALASLLIMLAGAPLFWLARKISAR